MVILKKFLADLTNLSRFQFACKYVFPALAIFLTWGALGNFYTLTFSKRKLIAHNGIVTGMETRLEIGTTQYQQIKYYPIIISLNNSSKEFRLRDNFKEYFIELQNNMRNGDTATVYTRTKFDALVSWGKEGDIYQIEKNGNVLFPLTVVKAYNSNQALILSLFALVLWMLYAVFRFRKK
jgi:hypothetical protein